MEGKDIRNAISSNWKENPSSIKTFLRETEKFDHIRGQDWKKTFPDIVDFYARYL
jgi:hypothetical protein